MKYLITHLLLLGLIAPAVWAQQPFGELDTNQIRVRFHAEGDMGWDLFSAPNFEVPKGSGKHTLFAAAPWIGAIDESGQLRMAAQTYRQTGEDYVAGPVADQYDSAYRRVWVVKADEIATHQTQHAQPGYTAPEAILTWPGNGDTTNGEAWQLAPFEDFNQNGVYEPIEGEVPAIKGSQAAFAIFNDGTIHGETGGQPLNAEIHMMAYAIDRPVDALDSWLNEVIFLDYKVFQRTGMALRQMYFGFWTDWDLGQFSDDFVGCDTAREAWFAYNADSLDDPPQGYGLQPPAMSAAWLNHPMAHHMYYNNDFTAIGNPEIAQQFYGYLIGQWKDGTLLTQGGSGYGSGTPTAYAFPGDPTQAGQWHESQAGSTPGDRRGLSSVGPFTLTPSEPVCVRLALIYGRDQSATGNHLTSIEVMKRKIDSVQANYASGDGEGCLLSGAQTGTTSLRQIPSQTAAWRIAPNPAQAEMRLLPPTSARGPVQAELMDPQGRVLAQQQGDAQQPWHWDVAAYPQGLYLLRIRSQAGVQVLRWRK